MINRITYWSLYDASVKRIAKYIEVRPESLNRLVAAYCAVTGLDYHVGLRHQRARILHELRNK